MTQRLTPSFGKAPLGNSGAEVDHSTGGGQLDIGAADLDGRLLLRPGCRTVEGYAI